MILELVSPTEQEPVTIDEARHYGLDAPDCVTIERAVKAARELAEEFTGRAFLPQKWKLSVYGNNQKRLIALPRPYVREIVSAKAKGKDVDYSFDVSNGTIQLQTEEKNVEITYKSHTWDDVVLVPEYVKQAICKAAYLIHDNRAGAALPDVAKADLMPLRITTIR